MQSGTPGRRPRWPRRTKRHSAFSSAALPVAAPPTSLPACAAMGEGGVSKSKDGGSPALAAAADWLKAGKVAVLNVAGPRESGKPGVHDQAAAFLRAVFALLGAG